MKYPAIGKVKTRIAKELGNEAAVDIHRQMVEWTLQNVQSSDWGTWCFVTPEESLCETRRWLGNQWSFLPQMGKELGERLTSAFQQAMNAPHSKPSAPPRGELRSISLCHPERSPTPRAIWVWGEVEGSKADSSTPSPQQVGAQSLRMTMLTKQALGPAERRASRNGTRKRFKVGKQKVIVIGTDSPWLGRVRIREAFGALDEADLVMGPAEDGGYYLIGMSRLIPELFQGIAWGTSQVFRQTCAIAKRLKLKVTVLPLGYDVDTVKDYERFQKEVCYGTDQQNQILQT